LSRYVASHDLAAASRWLPGSSSRHKAGSLSSNRARATRICHPPDSWSHVCSRLVNPRPLRTVATFCSCWYPPSASNRDVASSSRSKSSCIMAASMSCRAAFSSRIPDAASSYTVLLLPATAVCFKYPMPRSSSSSTSSSLLLLLGRLLPDPCRFCRGSPNATNAPSLSRLSIDTCPTIACSKVLLPAPLLPTNPHLVLGSIRQSMLCKICAGPLHTLAPSISNAAPLALSALLLLLLPLLPPRRLVAVAVGMLAAWVVDAAADVTNGSCFVAPRDGMMGPRL
jgi:hypothetical protein